MEIGILERQGLNRSHTKVANFVLLNSAVICFKNLPNGSDLSFGAVLRQIACSPLFWFSFSVTEHKKLSMRVTQT